MLWEWESDKKLEKVYALPSSSLSYKLYGSLLAIPSVHLIYQYLEAGKVNFYELIFYIAAAGGIGYFLKKIFTYELLAAKKNIKDGKDQIESLELLLTKIPWVWFFMIDEHEKYTRINEAFAVMVGKEIKDIIGKNDKELFPLLTDETLYDLLEKNKEAFITASPNILEETIILPLKDWERVLLLTKYPFTEDWKKQIIGVCADITYLTEQKKVLEQEKLSAETAAKKAHESAELQKAFSANMSHELRTPLNSLLWFTTLIAELSEDDENIVNNTKKIKEYIKIISQSGNHLLQLINNILDISRSEAGLLNVFVQEFDIQDLIEKTVSAQEIILKKKWKPVELHIDPSIQKIPNKILWDETKIQQIISNLVSNAIKFTHEGSITISCPEIIYNWSDSEIFISVKDTWIWVDPSKFHLIFEKFRQEEIDTTHKYWWTGLGLAIVKELCKLMWWTIQIESKGKSETKWPWWGSTFTFSFKVPL